MLLMVGLGLSSTLKTIINQKVSFKACTFIYRYCDADSLVCKNSDMCIASCHSMHTCLPLLLEVFTDFPQIKTIFTAIIFQSSQTCIHVHYDKVMKQVWLVRILILPIISYPHHGYHITLMTQDTFFFAKDYLGIVF